MTPGSSKKRVVPALLSLAAACASQPAPEAPAAPVAPPPDLGVAISADPSAVLYASYRCDDPDPQYCVDVHGTIDRFDVASGAHTVVAGEAIALSPLPSPDGKTLMISTAFKGLRRKTLP